MDVDGIIKLMVVTAVVVVPALGVTIRFALKPIVEAIVRLKEGGVVSSDSTAMLAEVRQLRAELQHTHDEVAQMRQELSRIQEAESFNLALRGGQESPAALPGSK
jgi:hypothetical protein